MMPEKKLKLRHRDVKRKKKKGVSEQGSSSGGKERRDARISLRY